MPPSYSAIKIKGTPAYKLARDGKKVDLKPRPVTIHSLKLLEYRHPFISLEVKCSAGTYIRSLAHDIGKRLKTGGLLEALHRTQAGDFPIDQAVELDSLNQDNWQEYLLPVKAGVGHLGQYVAAPADAKKIARGVKIAVAKKPRCRNFLMLNQES